MPGALAFPSDDERALLTMPLADPLEECSVFVECASVFEEVALLKVDLSARCMSV